MIKYVYDGLAGGLAWDQAWYIIAGISGLQDLEVKISDSPHPLKGEERLKTLEPLKDVRQTKRFVVAVVWDLRYVLRDTDFWTRRPFDVVEMDNRTLRRLASD